MDKRSLTREATLLAVSTLILLSSPAILTSILPTPPEKKLGVCLQFDDPSIYNPRVSLYDRCDWPAQRVFDEIILPLKMRVLMFTVIEDDNEGRASFVVTESFLRSILSLADQHDVEVILTYFQSLKGDVSSLITRLRELFAILDGYSSCKRVLLWTEHSLTGDIYRDTETENFFEVHRTIEDAGYQSGIWYVSYAVDSAIRKDSLAQEKNIFCISHANDEGELEGFDRQRLERDTATPVQGVTCGIWDGRKLTPEAVQSILELFVSKGFDYNILLGWADDFTQPSNAEILLRYSSRFS